MSPAAAPAISVRDLRKIYPSGVAVDGISFEVPAGRVVGLLGGNGAEPDLLLLDEPTASLDPDTADWIRTRLERYRIERGASLLLASHNMGEV
ncbi:MAG TPA: AAA family ATPase, partial [Beijerinckiaceae bacterium]|nr:AAA family ATPase [Beijerinckiaceae bacterium]